MNMHLPDFNLKKFAKEAGNQISSNFQRVVQVSFFFFHQYFLYCNIQQDVSLY